MATGQSSSGCTYTFFLPQWGEIELIFALQPGVSEIRGVFLNYHIHIWHETWPKFQKLHIYCFLPQGVEIELIFALQAVLSEIQANFQYCHIGMKLSHWPKCLKLHIYSLYYLRVPNFTLFCSTADHFQDIGNFPFSHRPQC